MKNKLSRIEGYEDFLHVVKVVRDGPELELETDDGGPLVIPLGRRATVVPEYAGTPASLVVDYDQPGRALGYVMLPGVAEAVTTSQRWALGRAAAGR